MPSNQQLLTTPAERVASAKQKKQLIIVALLLVSLLIAIATQPDKTSSAESAELAVTAVSTIAPSEASQDVSQETSRSTPTLEPNATDTIVHQLSRIEPEQAMQLDLFRVRTRNEVAEEAPESDVVIDAIYGRYVLIDGNVIEAGQSLPNGRQLLSVSADGIKVSK